MGMSNSWYSRDPGRLMNRLAVHLFFWGTCAAFRSRLVSQRPEEDPGIKRITLDRIVFQFCSVKLNTRWSNWELVLGTTLWLSGESFIMRSPDSLTVKAGYPPPYLWNLSPAQTRLQRRQAFVPNGVETFLPVVILVDSLWKLVQQLGEGPSCMNSDHDKAAVGSTWSRRYCWNWPLYMWRLPHCLKGELLAAYYVSLFNPFSA